MGDYLVLLKFISIMPFTPGIEDYNGQEISKDPIHHGSEKITQRKTLIRADSFSIFLFLRKLSRTYIYSLSPILLNIPRSYYEILEKITEDISLSYNRKLTQDSTRKILFAVNPFNRY